MKDEPYFYLIKKQTLIILGILNADFFSEYGFDGYLRRMEMMPLYGRNQLF
jgi:hypothetical protein